MVCIEASWITFRLKKKMSWNSRVMHVKAFFCATFRKRVCVQAVVNVSHNPQTTVQSRRRLTMLHGWLPIRFHWGLRCCTAHNCLPPSQAPPRQIWQPHLLYLGKHEPNMNTALHAWANPYRCHLIISHSFNLSWCVHNEASSSSPRPIQRSAMWLMRVTSKTLSLFATLVPPQAFTVWFKTGDTCSVLNGKVVLGSVWRSHTVAMRNKKLIIIIIKLHWLLPFERIVYKTYAFVAFDLICSTIFCSVYFIV